MKKEFILVMILALVLVSSALVPLTDTALAQSGNPSRSFSPDDQLLTDESFDVIVTFTAPSDEFNSIGLGDSVPAGWVIQVDTNWCTPNADFSNIVGDEAQYVWIGPYNSGQVFTAIYHVTVPSGASLGSHSFYGQLNYFIAARGLFSEDIGGNTEVMVTAPILEDFYTNMVVNPFNDMDVDIKPRIFPNSRNVKSKGVLPVAILGTASFDTTTFDPPTVSHGGYGISHIRGVPPPPWTFRERQR